MRGYKQLWRRLLIILPLLFLIMAASCSPVPAPASPGVPESGNSSITAKFSNPVKSAHYESNTPAHGAVLAGPPINVVIDFNFDLGKGSSISITNDGKEYGAGETTIDSSKLSMRRNVAPEMPDGLYTVNYKACWPDGSCHDGSFQFSIDRTKSADFMDMRGQSDVKVVLRNISFSPQKIRISKGSKVTWLNEDNVQHYVNTDGHPSHTYYPPQNSKGFLKGEQLSITFDKPGVYPYHCSAHSNMTGVILVE